MIFVGKQFYPLGLMEVAGGLPSEGVAEVASGSAVGARLTRVDGWPKVAGTDVFGADEAPADALWMRVVRSNRIRFTPASRPE